MSLKDCLKFSNLQSGGHNFGVLMILTPLTFAAIIGAFIAFFETYSTTSIIIILFLLLILVVLAGFNFYTMGRIIQEKTNALADPANLYFSRDWIFTSFGAIQGTGYIDASTTDNGAFDDRAVCQPGSTYYSNGDDAKYFKTFNDLWQQYKSGKTLSLQYYSTAATATPPHAVSHFSDSIEIQQKTNIGYYRYTACLLKKFSKIIPDANNYSHLNGTDLVYDTLPCYTRDATGKCLSENPYFTGLIEKLTFDCLFTDDESGNNKGLYDNLELTYPPLPLAGYPGYLGTAAGQNNTDVIMVFD
jgi:hypothetical protein